MELEDMHAVSDGLRRWSKEEHLKRYALLLQGKKNDAQSDFAKCLKRNSGQRVLIELHLRTIETQMKEMRRRRVEAQRNIS